MLQSIGLQRVNLATEQHNVVVIIGLPEIEESTGCKEKRKGGGLLVYSFIYINTGSLSCPPGSVLRAGDTAVSQRANLSALGEVASQHRETDTNKQVDNVKC